MEVIISNREELRKLLNTINDNSAFIMEFDSKEDKENERSKREWPGAGSGIHKT